MVVRRQTCPASPPLVVVAEQSAGTWQLRTFGQAKRQAGGQIAARGGYAI